MQEINYRKQDEKFVAWSRGVSGESYDVCFTIDKIRQEKARPICVLDVGGGIGSAANAIVGGIEDAAVDVIDVSPLARDAFIGGPGTRFVLDDFLTRPFDRRYDAILMRTLLHHLVADTEAATRDRQLWALRKARELLVPGGAIFVTENFYEPILFHDITGRLIFETTKLRSIARIVSGLGANTAGEGVRFRSWRAWQDMFAASGLSIVDSIESDRWGERTPFWQKKPLLCRSRFQAAVMLVPANSRNR